MNLPRRIHVFFIAVAGLTVCACFVASHLAWNHTDSLPRGLYARHSLDRAPLRGEIVAFDVPAIARELVEQRAYLPARALLFKVVVGLPGDRVCLDHRQYHVNEALIGPVLVSDSVGDLLPVFTFCDVVPRDTYFVAATGPRSFDSRYFGPVRLAELQSRLVPLWTY